MDPVAPALAHNVGIERERDDVKAQRSRDITWSIYILANLIITFPQFVTSPLIDTEGELLIPY